MLQELLEGGNIRRILTERKREVLLRVRKENYNTAFGEKLAKKLRAKYLGMIDDVQLGHEDSEVPGLFYHIILTQISFSKLLHFPGILDVMER